MIVYLIIAAGIVVSAGIIIFRITNRIKLKKQLAGKLSELALKTRKFFDELAELEKHFVSIREKDAFVSKWSYLNNELSLYRIPKKASEYSELNKFIQVFADIEKHFESTNTNFLQAESQKYDAFFSNIDGKSLDTQQRTAVIDDEDRVLVLAGAGSGKTLTIAAKVKYLCEIKKVNPKDILLISFTRKSAQEMTERIQNKLGINATATTFHKLGLDVITHSAGKRPDVCDETLLNQFVHDFFESDILNHPDLVKNLTEFFAYFLDVPNNLEDYSSLGELYEEEKTADLETLKSKYTREKFIRETATDKSKSYITLNNERVKSIEETKIANFLFMHDINYEYEKQYPFESSDPLHKSYQPDFYLTDYDIYLEHFGISKDYTLPWLSKVEEKKYLDGIKWKRELHKTHGTKLIETYSYYSSQGILFQKLEEILAANGVKLKDREFTDVFNTVYDSKSNRYFSEFIKLCCTFVTLFKSNNYRVDEIDYMIKRNDAEKNAFMRQRAALFLEIVKTILIEYQNHLVSKNLIDFSDMINNAADRIKAGCEIPPYKYIIVDEYQDISKSRFNLIKTIADRTDAKVFCVGDDWQSIYRFAGSDISLFTDFSKFFGHTEILKIEKTYRNSQNLIDEASRFILQNPKQMKKSLRSDKKLDFPLVFWGYDKDPSQVLNMVIRKIVSEFGADSSILLLGRTNYDVEILKQSGLFDITFNNRKEELIYKPMPELKISFMSVHKSKGLEADNVVLLNFSNKKLGFPNQMADDKVLNLVLTDSEAYRFAEERRLFYVAITRTKNRTFVLTDNEIPSPFFKEFNESKNVCYVSIKKKRDDSTTLCPRCKTGSLIKVEHNGHYFVGCSNYPNCDYKLRDATILANPKKCPDCGGFLVKRKGKNKHSFLGCTNYPYCEYTEELKK
ncbi:MAG: UvrD-helicase domain-containing protein [Treponema sp.]|nr:UvrD-helicase domain-containing protein [Treponema sp.]